MNVRVTKDRIKIDYDSDIHKGEFKINKCEFVFTEDYTADLVKVAVFTTSNATYRVVIEDDECDIPYEALSTKGTVVFGVYAYKVESDELVLRYSPRPALMAVQDGSYVDSEEGSIYVPASTIEEYEQALKELLDNVEASTATIVQEITQEVEDTIDEKVTEALGDVETAENTAITNIQAEGASYDERIADLELLASNINTASVTPGDTIDIENSLNGKTKKQVIYGQAGQVTTTGKNKLNVPSSYSVTGTQNVNVNLPANVSHTLSMEGVVTTGTGNTFLFLFMDANNETVVTKNLTTTNKSVSFTPTSDVAKVIIYAQSTYNASQGVTTTFTNLMIRETSTTDTYEPYSGERPSPSPDYPQAIKVVTGDVEVLTLSENYFNQDALLNATWQSATYRYTVVDLPKDSAYYCKAVLKTGKTKISGLYGFITNTGGNPNSQTRGVQLLSNGDTWPEALVRFYPEDTIYFSYYPKTLSVNEILDTYDFMVCKDPSQAYTPYQGSFKLTLPLGNIELANIEDYEDKIFCNEKGNPFYDSTLEEGAWYKYSLLNLVELDGSESYLTWGLLNTDYFSAYVNKITSAPAIPNGNIISDHFPFSNYATVANATNIGCFTGGNYIGVSVPKSILSDVSTQSAAVASIKSWFTSNHSKFLYTLATPTYTKITDTSLLTVLNSLKANLQTYKNITHVTITASDINPKIGFEYYKDDRVETNNKLASLEARIELLET